MNDPWRHLRQHTAARIALGRAGGSLPTREVLAFAADHAAARDAVHTPLDVDRLEAELRAVVPACVRCVRLESAAPDRQTYLQRPDLGRRLSDASANAIALGVADCDVALVVADGLSAPAAQSHAAPLLALLVPQLHSAGLSTSPIHIVRLARVAIEDEIGQRARARTALILLGERPGLGSADSLGAYIVFAPHPGRTDAERNCVSNIRPAGLALPAAAATLQYLLTTALGRRLSGVALKDDRDPSAKLI